MRKQPPRIVIEHDVPMPQFAVHRVEDFLMYWRPNVISLKDLAFSLYMQGIADGWAAGERFASKGSQLFPDDIEGVPV